MGGEESRLQPLYNKSHRSDPAQELRGELQSLFQSMHHQLGALEQDSGLQVPVTDAPAF